jgi:hypothetical protein
MISNRIPSAEYSRMATLMFDAGEIMIRVKVLCS